MIRVCVWYLPLEIPGIKLSACCLLAAHLARWLPFFHGLCVEIALQSSLRKWENASPSYLTSPLGYYLDHVAHLLTGNRHSNAFYFKYSATLKDVDAILLLEKWTSLFLNFLPEVQLVPPWRMMIQSYIWEKDSKWTPSISSLSSSWSKVKNIADAILLLRIRSHPVLIQSYFWEVDSKWTSIVCITTVLACLCSGAPSSVILGNTRTTTAIELHQGKVFSTQD